MKDGKRIDPAQCTLFANLFSGIAQEMGVTLKRTAYSPNIKERRDFSCALFDAQGRLVAQAAHIPVHLGAMPLSVACVLETFGPLSSGDIVALNDPFSGGTHLPDLTLVSPVIPGNSRPGSATDPIAYLATRAHHADMGGMAPGSMPLSSEIYQEGLRIPPVKVACKGVMNEAVIALLEANVRTPDERAGDLRAQTAAHKTGTDRLLEAAAKYGAPLLRRRMDDLLAYGRRLMEARISSMPDGVFSFEDALDDDGFANRRVRIRAKITIRGKTVSVDFDGSDPACQGNLNAVEAVTRSAVYYCFLCLLVTPGPQRMAAARAGAAGSIAEPPINAGCFAPITVRAPRGSIVNALMPHAVAGGNVETSQRIVDVVFGALSKAMPDRIPAASQGTMNNLAVGGTDPRTGRRFAYYETIAGGMGARPGQDGLDAVHAHMTNTLNTPVEALEFAYPLQVVRYEIARGTGGSGRFRGGDGVRRDLRVLTDCRASLLSERRSLAPYGLRSGKPGATGKNRLIRGKRKSAIPGKALIDLRAGDVISIQTPGGGGWGEKPD